MPPARKNSTADQAWVRKVNRSLILGKLRKDRTYSRSKLAQETGLNASTVSSIVNDLISENFVRETEFQQPEIGGNLKHGLQKRH